MSSMRAILLSAILSATSGCGIAFGADTKFNGGAHWYGNQFHGRRTASGAVFDKTKFTAAHPHLSFGTMVHVKSKHTGKDVIVEITDRCPVRKDRVIDLSEAAAKQIGIWPAGKNEVVCEVVPPPATKPKGSSPAK